MWKDVVGFEGLYKVSDKGEVYSVRRDKVLKPQKSNIGYIRIELHKNKKKSKKSIHRLVAEAFLENKDNLKEVNHIDLNKENNSVENLEWCTSSQNKRHYRKTTGKRGVTFERHAAKKWRSSLYIDAKRYTLGYFENKEEAYKAYYDTYLEFYGIEPFSL